MVEEVDHVTFLVILGEVLADGSAVGTVPLSMKLEDFKPSIQCSLLAQHHLFADSGVTVVVCGLLLLLVALVAHLGDDVALICCCWCWYGVGTAVLLVKKNDLQNREEYAKTSKSAVSELGQ